LSTTWIGSSSGDGIANGWTMMEKGMPDDVSSSPVCGIVLIVDRMYLLKELRVKQNTPSVNFSYKKLLK
tara:strand:+ start:752 stop:958 length:207 start_codon:yes stop_codon:yes gene_type:complete